MIIGQYRWRLKTTMKTAGIYKITNLINGKVYVGQTIDYRRRRIGHLSALKLGNHHNKYLQSSYTKYGVNNFEMKLIKSCSKSELNDLEKHYIQELDCLHDAQGYNILIGGNENMIFTDAIREKLSLSRRGEKNHNADISNEEAEQIILMLLNNEDVNEISSKLGVSVHTVYNLLHNRSYTDIMPDVREELKKIKKTNDKRKINTAVKMYLEGYSQNEVSKKIKISRNTLRKALQERNINTQKHINQFVVQTNTEINN